MNSLMALGHSFESVIAAAKLGTDWAWAVIYREISGPVVGFFRSRGVTSPEDAAGDVFFDLARGLATYEGDEDAFRTLVFAMAYKRLLAESRTEERRTRSALADRVIERIRSECEQSELVIDIREVSEDLRQALAALTPEQGDVLSLRIIAGLSVEQTAKVVGRTIDSVRAIQRRGLARVRHRTTSQLVVA